MQHIVPRCCLTWLPGALLLNTESSLLPLTFDLAGVQDITVKWEKLRHPDTTAVQRTEVVHEILNQVTVSFVKFLRCLCRLRLVCLADFDSTSG